MATPLHSEILPSPALGQHVAEAWQQIVQKTRDLVERIVPLDTSKKNLSSALPQAIVPSFSEQEIEDLMQRILWAFPVQMVGGFRSDLIRALNSRDIQEVCKVLQSALRRVTPLPGTDVIYQTMAPEYFEDCPADLVQKYQNRLTYWNALNQLSDGTVIQEGTADNKRPRTVDFSLRLERLIKLGQVGNEVRKDWAKRCDIRKAKNISPVPLSTV